MQNPESNELTIYMYKEINITFTGKRTIFETRKSPNFHLTNMYWSKRKGTFFTFNFKNDEDKEDIKKKSLRNLKIIVNLEKT